MNACLKNITIDNFAVYHNTRFSCVAASNRKERYTNTFVANDQLVNKVSFIYGKTGSGKSCLVNAIRFIQNVIKHAMGGQGAFPIIQEISAQHQFPVSVRIEMCIDNYDYQYSFSIGKTGVEYEQLTKKRVRTEVLLVRDNKGTLTLKSSFKNHKYHLTQIINDCMNNTDEYQWRLLLPIFYLGGFEDAYIVGAISNLVVVSDEDIDIPRRNVESNREVATTYLLKHGFMNDNSIEEGIREYRPDGMDKLVYMYMIAFQAIQNGNVVIVDDIDSYLDLKASLNFVHLFTGNMNTNNAQLICTTGQPLLLEDNTKKDQVWFVERDEHKSILYRMSIFKYTHTTVSLSNKIIKMLLS